ncbi:MAG: hypothetical protein Fues2KO_03470 [Fuerstiella sp.]
MNTALAIGEPTPQRSVIGEPAEGDHHDHSSVTLRQRIADSNLLSSLVAIADQAIVSGTNFVTAVLIGRCCGADQLGVYSLIVSTLALLYGFQEQLITAPYVMFHHRRRGHALHRYQGSMFGHQFLFTTLVLIALLVVQQTSILPSAHSDRLIVVLAVAIPAMLFRAFLRETALAHCDLPGVLIMDLTLSVVQLGTLSVLWWNDAVSLQFLFGVIGIMAVLTTCLKLYRERKVFHCRPKFFRLHWHRNFRFGRWALATHVAGSSTPFLMPWVLFLMHGETATGQLASCSVIVGVANLLLSGLSDFLTPRAALAYQRGGVIRLQRILTSMGGVSLAAIGPVCVVALLFGQSMLDLLYDSRFPNTGPLVALLTFAVLANAMGNVAGNGLWALNRPRANFVADLITLTAAIAGVVVFVRPHGAFGAAIAVLVAAVIGAAARIAICRREFSAANAATA